MDAGIRLESPGASSGEWQQLRQKGQNKLDQAENNEKQALVLSKLTVQVLKFTDI